MAQAKKPTTAKRTTKKSTTRKNTPASSAPIKKTITKPTLPKLSEVAPELKNYIVNSPKPKNDYSYWQALAWAGLGLIGILIATGSAIWLIDLKNPKPKTIKAQPLVTTPQLTDIAPLTGLLTTPDTLSRRPWAVVVENFFTVRPQAGLVSADIVFESPTEGGITRLVAIYQSQLPALVGPIRSARSYFNDWIRPFSPFYSHSGGSDRALQQLRSGYGNIIDINEFFHGAAYSRQSGLSAPHNLFTTPDKFLGYLENNNYETSINPPQLSFTSALPDAPEITSITLPYAPQEYEVTYEYQALTNNYQRLVDGTTQLDATNNKILTVKNVVVLLTDIDPIPGDPLLRVELRTLGRGEARVYTGGRVYSGTWRKNSPDSLIELVDSTGIPLPLQPGNTWFSVLDSSSLVNLPEPASINIPLSF